MASTLTLEFLIDFEIDYGINIVTENVLPQAKFDWVNTRSTNGEVTTGTPTGIVGAITAEFFKQAWEIDNPSYSISRIDNVVLITANGNDLFNGIRGLDENGDRLVLGVDYNATYNNEFTPPDATDVELILTRSPHYVNVPYLFSETTSATLSLYVYDGDIGNVPANPSYVVTQTRPASNFMEANFNISNYVNDFLDAKIELFNIVNPELLDSDINSVKWVKYIVNYTDSENSIADIQGSFSALRGFGLYGQGVNPSKPNESILTPCNKRKVSSDGVILFPFINDGTNTDFNLSTENLEINETVNLITSVESTEYVQYIYFDVSDVITDKIVTITDNNLNKYIYNIEKECRYQTKQIIFLNRYGAFDSITMFKKSSNTLSVNKDKFTNNYLQNGSYDVTRHQIKDINIQATEKLTVNSGYINESENELYKDLMVSDIIYLFEDNNLVPLRISKNSLEIKNRVNDGLVNYTLDFDYAFNYIQNV